ncbi:hypothetical protein G3R49_19560 [Shewanella sp. WXL01]|uniref:hypothetical protein n=1 Tax=Shewanella sp. WXL01 TaxID=2709721 RepID=UPI0014382D92|nr:hypothetical protein [Shewanella sp. WXL01]NKF52757.1 hypothetical protein [Shewanella sp. WXL01]
MNLDSDTRQQWIYLLATNEYWLFEFELWRGEPLSIIPTTVEFGSYCIEGESFSLSPAFFAKLTDYCRSNLFGRSTMPQPLKCNYHQIAHPRLNQISMLYYTLPSRLFIQHRVKPQLQVGDGSAPGQLTLLPTALYQDNASALITMEHLFIFQLSYQADSQLAVIPMNYYQ